jgi:hypothetical protein
MDPTRPNNSFGTVVVHGRIRSPLSSPPILAPLLLLRLFYSPVAAVIREDGGARGGDGALCEKGNTCPFLFVLSAPWLAVWRARVVGRQAHPPRVFWSLVVAVVTDDRLWHRP